MDDKDVIYVYCKKCDVAERLEVTPQQTEDLIDRAGGEGKLIQDILPEVPADVRELFVSGMCNTCWHKLFQDEEMWEE